MPAHHDLSLLSLPPELRNMVYLSFFEPFMGPKQLSREEFWEMVRCSNQLRLVNKQIQREAHSLYVGYILQNIKLDCHFFNYEEFVIFAHQLPPSAWHIIEGNLELINFGQSDGIDYPEPIREITELIVKEAGYASLDEMESNAVREGRDYCGKFVWLYPLLDEGGNTIVDVEWDLYHDSFRTSESIRIKGKLGLLKCFETLIDL
jgi:hypothetical protein